MAERARTVDKGDSPPVIRRTDQLTTKRQQNARYSRESRSRGAEAELDGALPSGRAAPGTQSLPFSRGAVGLDPRRLHSKTAEPQAGRRPVVLPPSKAGSVPTKPSTAAAVVPKVSFVATLPSMPDSRSRGQSRSRAPAVVISGSDTNGRVTFSRIGNELAKTPGGGSRRGPTSQRGDAPPPPPPVERLPEDDYETRPMSPHAPYRLANHLAARGSLLPPPEIKDNFEARMRSLFLPSLFGSTEDLRFQARRQQQQHAKVQAAAGAPAAAGMAAAAYAGSLPSEEVGLDGQLSSGFGLRVKHGRGGDSSFTPFADRISSNAKRTDFAIVDIDLKARPTAIAEDVGGGGGTASLTTGTAATAAPAGAHGVGTRGAAPRPGSSRPKSGRNKGFAGGDAGARPKSSNRSRSAARRVAFMSSTKRAGSSGGAGRRNGGGSRGAGVKIPIATIDRGVAELYPLDMDQAHVRWKFALYETLKSKKIKKEVLEDRFLKMKMDEMNPAEVALSAYAKDREHVISALRIRKVFDIPVSSREERDLDQLDAILGRFPIFSKLPPTSRYKLYNSCKLETFPRGTVLIRESLQARSCYVIILGECLFQNNPGLPTCVTTRVQFGGAVGEFASYALNEVRTLRAQCLMRTECLRIDKGDFVTIMREAKSMDSYAVEFFQSLPQFFNVDKSIPVLLSQRSLVRRYEPETLILKANEEGPNIYFIVRGKARALHMVTFVKVDEGPMANSIHRKYSLVPFRGQPVRPGDEIVRELALVMDMTQGQCFPPLALSRVTKEARAAAAAAAAAATSTAVAAGQQGPAPVRSLSVTGGGGAGHRPSMSVSDAAFFGFGGVVAGAGSGAGNGAGVGGASGGASGGGGEVEMLPSPFHFIVIDRLEVLVVSRQDLYDLVPPDVLRKLAECRALTDISSQEIEERYLTAQGWRGGGAGGGGGKEWEEQQRADQHRDAAFKDASSWGPVPVWRS
ncbi:hypothetical protein DFJ73DRAFT_772718 [Zopfochytrium polystomum]|nr:hypothetical protein DFJ73DRAFT_772718 [Zopfochytrium polystomum]